MSPDPGSSRDLVDEANVPLSELLVDLEAEQTALDNVIAHGEGDVGLAETPADGWNVRDTIAHLVQGEELAALAVEDGEGFQAALTSLMADLAKTLEEFAMWSASATLPEMHERWVLARRRLIEALAGASATDRVPWVVGDMSAGTFVRSRLMEAWAHGLDLADGLAVRRTESDRRLRHLAYLGERTRGHAHRNRGLTIPTTTVRLELVSPDGVTWVSGPQDAVDVVRGSAFDFAAVVTQRRHPSDTALEIQGPDATAWIAIAQCFAGPATEHRPAGSFVDGAWRR